MAAILVLAGILGCSEPVTDDVVVYASIDEIYARQIFDAFTRETGIAVRPVFDIEENKTVGLVNRIVAEREHPQADVFWNGECSRTVQLQEQRLLEPYRPPTAESIGAPWRDPGDAWVGFGARARVIVYNTKKVAQPPRTVDELAAPAWRGRVAIGNPRFGTTATHVAALAQNRGEEATLKLLAALKANDVRIAGGNSHVRDLVALGDRDVGLTDSDDVWIGKARGDPIDMVYPDQEGIGTLAIPNTVALVRGAPRAANGRRFIDWLARPETEAMLARGPSRQMPVRSGVDAPKDVPSLPSLRMMKVDWGRATTTKEFADKVQKALGI